jgi:hypothetical protein
MILFIHQLDNNIHVPLNQNKNQEYDENNFKNKKIVMKIIQQNNLGKKKEEEKGIKQNNINIGFFFKK